MPEHDPNLDTDDDFPLAGMAYEETKSDFQFTFLAKYNPNSRATLYTGLGFVRYSAYNKLSLGNGWVDEYTAVIWATPAFHVGMTGRITDWLDLYLGASKRWQQWSGTHHALDERIPVNADAQGPQGSAVVEGSEDNTNENRREIDETASTDVSTTKLMIGTRFHLDGFQISAHLDPTTLFRGPAFIFGSTGTDAPLFWISLIYDWDFDLDKDTGNGEHNLSAHKAESGTTPAAAPAEEEIAPAPAEETYDDFGEEEVFDS